MAGAFLVKGKCIIYIDWMKIAIYVGAFAKVATKYLSFLKLKIRTITIDNGQGFTTHDRTSKNLGKKYCSHPYYLWDKGIKEDPNRLLFKSKF